MIITHALRLPVKIWQVKHAAVLLALLTVQRWSIAGSMDYNPPGEIVSIGTAKLHMHCVGEGTPTVVVDTGLGESALEWLPVQQRIRHYTRICLYDRAGYGWSEFGELPRSSSRIANELYSLLLRANEKGPYVLVGHSYGGMNMQLFARRYPYLTAGMVLVDSSNPAQISRLTLPHLDSVDEIHPSSVGGIATQDFVAKPVLPKILGEEGPELLALMLMSRVYTMRTVANEYLNFKASARQVLRNKGRFPDVPLVVLSRGQLAGDAGGDWAHGNEDTWRLLQAELTHLAPRAAHVIATLSGHAIHNEQPDLVADSVNMVVDFARAKAERTIGGLAHHGDATTMLPFADAVWVYDTLHTAADVCPFGCTDQVFDAVIVNAGHVAGTPSPEWQRVYRRPAAPSRSVEQTRDAAVTDS